MAVVPAAALAWWVMPAIYGGISLLTTALSYLLKSHAKKPNAFDSPTYGWQGMANSYEPGTPLNLPYGDIRLPPAIINWYRRGNGGKTRAHFIGSLGHGQIAGCRGIELNGLPIRHYYSKFNKDCEIYMTHGEYQQKVYKFVKEVKGTLNGAITTSSTSFSVTITNSRSFQTASAKEPGYLLIYTDDTDTGKETYEFVRYLSVSVVGLVATFKGVRISKSHSSGDNVVQMYKIEKDDTGIVREIIPHIGSVSTFHQDINNIELTNSWSSIFTTNGKVDAFATTFEFPEGLYKFDNDDGYKPHQVKIAVRWKAVGEGSWVTEGTDRTVLPETEHTIKVTKNKNYAILVDASTGVEITGTEETFDYLDNIKEGMEIDFEGVSKGQNADFTYVIDTAFADPTGDYTPSSEDGHLIPLYRGKIKFKSRINPSEKSSGKYEGGDVTKKTYSIWYHKSININSAKILIPEKPKTIQGSYQVTFQFPQDGLGDEEKLPSYKQYEIQYKLVLPLIPHNITSDAHKIVITSIEDIKLDDLVYPGEALIGMRLLMTEKISGSLDNITTVVHGLLVKDTSEDISSLTQWAAGTVFSSLVDGDGQPIRRRALATAKDCQHAYRLIKIGTTATLAANEPAWQPISGAVIFDGTCEWQEDSCKWNDNPLDIICDLQQNKMYGRGQYLDFNNTILNDLYDSYNMDDANGITDREYCNHNITENGKVRDRIDININIDFRQPLMDTLEVLAKSARAYNYWDGQKLLTYIDRYRAPVTMVNNAVIVPDSFMISEVNVEDKINRIYASILNRYRGYKQDQVGRDYIDEGYTIGDLVMEQIHLYGISDKWHAIKILSYMLKYSKNIKHIAAFEQGIDACIYDVGDVFYFSHEAVNNSTQIGTAKKWSATCGRVIAISGATFTADKDVAVANGQKVLFRNDNGTATEYIINSQSGRVVTCSATITSVSINSIYSFGTADINNEYYRLFTCVAKKPKEYTYEILAITYDDNVFKDIYDTATPSQETSGATISNVEENDELNSMDFSKSPPPPITHAIVKEDPLVQGEAVIYITAPIGGNWSYAEIQYKNIDSEEWSFAGKTTGNPLRVSGLIAGESYEYEIRSFSYGSQSSDIVIHDTFVYGEDDNAVGLPIPKGFQIANRMGTLGNVYGRAFKFRWDEMTSQTKESLTYAMRKAGYEKLKYYLEIYFSAIPSTVKIGNTSVRDMIARHETLNSNKFTYDYEDTMEDISKIFENYSTHTSYNTYYNVPQRTIRARLYCINDYSKKSAYTELTLTNPAPGAYLSNGTTKITPILKKLKSGIRVSFPHPYDSNGDEEYDLSHIMIERCENTNFTGGTLKKRKVMSSITVNSNDEDVSATTYQEDFKGLDPKKTYYFRLRFYDVFGTSTETTSLSSTANIQPGVTDDDEEDIEDKIEPPEQVSGVTLSINSNNNVVIKWNNPSVTHATDIIEAIVDWRASQFTGTPILPLSLTSVGGDVPILGEVDQGYLNSDNAKLVIGEKTPIKINTDESELYTTNRKIIKSAKVGYTYFVRIRFRNSSGKEGAWSAWAYNTTAVTGLSSDDFDYDFKKFIFSGTFSAADIDTVTWSTGILQFKNTNGSTIDYSITNAADPTRSTGNMTEAMWIVWPGDAPNANNKFKALTSAQYLAATGKTPMAFCQKGDTGQVAFFSRFSDKKDFQVNSSFISAGSIITAHLAALSVEASKMNINGTLTMGHSSGAKMLFQDNNSVNRIKISATNGGTPKMIISKPGINADTATDPNDMLFSTHDADGNSIKTSQVLLSNTYTLQSGEIPTYTFTEAGFLEQPDVNIATSVSGMAARQIRVQFKRGDAWIYENPYIVHQDQNRWMVYQVSHAGVPNGNVRLRRTLICTESVGGTFPDATSHISKIYYELKTSIDL